MSAGNWLIFFYGAEIPTKHSLRRFWNQRGNGGNDGASVGNWLEQAKACEFMFALVALPYLTFIPDELF